MVVSEVQVSRRIGELENLLPISSESESFGQIGFGQKRIVLEPAVLGLRGTFGATVQRKSGKENISLRMKQRLATLQLN